MDNNYSRTFNLNGRPYYRRDREEDKPEEDRRIPKIEKSITYEEQSSGVGSFLIRLILCITVFSSVMLMKNSANTAVGIIYDAVEAWSLCNYSIPEEYSVEKFVDAIKSGDIVSVFSDANTLELAKPCNAEAVVHYGDKDINGLSCLGTVLSSEDEKSIVCGIDGTVTDISESASFVQCITVESNGIKIKYGYCDLPCVSVGDAVTKNTVLASTAKGNDNKYYAYVEVTKNGKLIDPEKCFEKNESNA